MLHERERRVAPVLPQPGATGRKSRERVDAPRPGAPEPLLLPTMDPMAPEPEAIDAATALDDLLLLPPAARRDLLTARWEANL